MLFGCPSPLLQINTYVEEEDEDTVKHSTKALANRQSFLVMRDQMRARGEEVRASLELDAGKRLGWSDHPSRCVSGFFP